MNHTPVRWVQAPTVQPALNTDLIVTRWGARFMGRHIPCAIGRGGIVQDKVEGDLGTPVGTYRLLWMYWRPDRGAEPETILPCYPLGPRQGWSESPDDPAYNQPVLHPHPWPADGVSVFLSAEPQQNSPLPGNQLLAFRQESLAQMQNWRQRDRWQPVVSDTEPPIVVSGSC